MISNEPAGQNPPTGIRTELAEKIRASEAILILSVPIFLLLIYLLPTSVQETLIVDYESPSFFNLWSSAFVHRNYNHFINNLASYALIIPVYVLLLLAEERNLFQMIFLTFIFPLPVGISMANVVFIGQGTGAGFSGIGSALFGVLPVALFLFIHNRISEDVAPTHSVVFFLAGVGLIALVYMGPEAVGIFLVTGLLAAFDVHRVGLDEVERTVVELVAMDGYLELVLFAGLMFLASPVVLFPSNIVQGDMVVNIFSHYLGLVCGFAGPLILVIQR